MHGELVSQPLTNQKLTFFNKPHRQDTRTDNTWALNSRHSNGPRAAPSHQRRRRGPVWFVNMLV